MTYNIILILFCCASHIITMGAVATTPGLGDELLELLMGAATRDFAMFITDTQVAVGAGEGTLGLIFMGEKWPNTFS